MGRRIGFALGVLILSGFLRGGQEKVNPRDLGPRYQEFLKLTTYIITDKEKDVFLKLANDRDRDLFVAAFWRIRDPTPGTPQNEYKDEIEKRFREANQKFHRTSPREGWLTDQGRVYIILGPPVSIERIEGGLEVYSCEIWSYYGSPEKGMPTNFSFVFYQRGGAGEFRLYDPVSDGPANLLLHGREMDPLDYEAVYDRINQAEPTLAAVCLSIVPGDIPYGYQPSPQDTILVANILESPKKAVSDSYATHFLNYKGVVSTEYLTNYIESDAGASIIQDPQTGAAFCNFAIAPKQLSLDYYEPKDQYFCAFQVDVSLRAGEKIIYQYSKEFPVSIPAGELEKTRRTGVCIEDSFPVIEGKYKLTVLLRNTTGKEFTTLERDLEIQEAAGRPGLTVPIVGYKFLDTEAGVRLPFQIAGRKIGVDPKNTFSAADQIAFMFSVTGLTKALWKEGSVGIAIKGAKLGQPFRKSFSVPLSGQAYQRVLGVALSLPAAEFPPDYYDLMATLRNGKGDSLDERTAHFVLSSEKALPHPVSSVKSFPVAGSFMFFYMLAAQYDKIDENEKAEAAYKKAYGLNPSYKTKIPDYAGFLLKVKKYGEALELAESLRGDEKLRFQYCLLRGRALAGLERYAEAVEILGEGNKIYNSDTGLLNTLGFCYYKRGQIQNARNALNASLKLNPDQDEARKLLREIEDGKK
jgi:GWxTD domain-containing protein